MIHLRHFLAILCVALAGEFSSVSDACAQLVKVKTGNGDISGYAAGKVAVFKGVPYAAPPVGDLRWRAPQPGRNWDGVFECKTWPASAMQAKPLPFMMWTEEFIAPPEPLSEDCLYLNIWTSARSSRKRFPVMVWIHGGGFTGGSGSCAV
jgi:para-nitrobenzyl esterase